MTDRDQWVAALVEYFDAEAKRRRETAWAMFILCAFTCLIIIGEILLARYYP